MAIFAVIVTIARKYVEWAKTPAGQAITGADLLHAGTSSDEARPTQRRR